VAAGVEAEGPYITAERVAEIRELERAKCRATAVPWAERSPANTPETRAALGWLLADCARLTSTDTRTATGASPDQLMLLSAALLRGRPAMGEVLLRTAEFRRFRDSSTILS
jgi:hypothetical protein